MFIFDLTDNFDTVKDFNRNYDALYLADILEGTTYSATTGDNVSDFLFAEAYSGNTYLSVDVDGQGGGAERVYFASLENVTGLGDIDTMIANWQAIL